MSADTAADNRVWFVYNGQDRNEIPRNVTHIRVASSVTEIPAEIFRECETLIEVQLPKGLLVIGNRAFYFCTSLHLWALNEACSMETEIPDRFKSTRNDTKCGGHIIGRRT